jgi:hypothetical protein
VNGYSLLGALRWHLQGSCHGAAPLLAQQLAGTTAAGILVSAAGWKGTLDQTLLPSEAQLPDGITPAPGQQEVIDSIGHAIKQVPANLQKG